MTSENPQTSSVILFGTIGDNGSFEYELDNSIAEKLFDLTRPCLDLKRNKLLIPYLDIRSKPNVDRYVWLEKDPFFSSYSLWYCDPSVDSQCESICDSRMKSFSNSGLVWCPGDISVCEEIISETYGSSSLSSSDVFRYSKTEIQNVLRSFIKRQLYVKNCKNLLEKKTEEDVKEEALWTVSSVEVVNKKKYLTSLRSEEELDPFRDLSQPKPNRMKVSKVSADGERNTTSNFYIVSVTSFWQLERNSCAKFIQFEEHTSFSSLYPLCRYSPSRGSKYGKYCSNIATNIFAETNPSRWRCDDLECQSLGIINYPENLRGLNLYFEFLRTLLVDNKKHRYIVTTTSSWDILSGEIVDKNKDLKHDSTNHGMSLAETDKDISYKDPFSVIRSAHVYLKEKREHLAVYYNSNVNYKPGQPESVAGLISPKPSPNSRYYFLDYQTITIEDDEITNVWDLNLFKHVVSLKRKKTLPLKIEEIHHHFSACFSRFIVVSNISDTEIWHINSKKEGHLLMKFDGQLI